MADINVRNRTQLNIAKLYDQDVAFSYCAKSDGHERVVAGEVVEVTNSHVTLKDRVRENNYRVFILDRIRGSILRLSNQ